MPAATTAVVVMGIDGAAVAKAVAKVRDEGARVAGFVGDDEVEARTMGAEVLGGVDEVLRV
ncbi:MAG: hypothetical protein ABIS21_01120 [Acidimicrobiales bacterium]